MSIGKLFIISHSALDIISVLNMYEKQKSKRKVFIIVSGNRENIKILEELGLPKNALKYLEQPSKLNFSKFRIIRYIKQLLLERKDLDKLKLEIGSDSNNELVFHSDQFDSQIGYLVANLTNTNHITFIDILGLTQKRLNYSSLISWIGLKNIIDYFILTLVFGKFYFIAGNKSSPRICLDINVCKPIKIIPFHKVEKTPAFAYRQFLDLKGLDVVLLYSEPYGVNYEDHSFVYSSILKLLSSIDMLTIHVKLHPQAKKPNFFKSYNISFIPKHIPFELIDLRHVFLVIGEVGASLLHPEAKNIISILKLTIEEKLDIYIEAMEQTGVNSKINYVSSIEELKSNVIDLINKQPKNVSIKY